MFNVQIFNDPTIIDHEVKSEDVFPTVTVTVKDVSMAQHKTAGSPVH